MQPGFAVDLESPQKSLNLIASFSWTLKVLGSRPKSLKKFFKLLLLVSEFAAAAAAAADNAAISIVQT